jgi:hypothetical protein
VHVTVDRISSLPVINSWFSTSLLSLNIDNTRFMLVVTKNSSLIDLYKKVKVKQSRYRPGVAQRVPGS